MKETRTPFYTVNPLTVVINPLNNHNKPRFILDL